MKRMEFCKICPLDSSYPSDKGNQKSTSNCMKYFLGGDLEKFCRRNQNMLSFSKSKKMVRYSNFSVFLKCSNIYCALLCRYILILWP